MPQANPETWKHMLLRSTPPAWLSPDAPQTDVVLSSRCRIMRNLRGFRFPHHASVNELIEVSQKVEKAAKGKFDAHRRLTNAERDYLVGCRLISPEFPWMEMGRAVLLDKEHACSAMVNEEDDHIRLQAVTAGWSVDHARRTAEGALAHLGKELEFAHDPELGYLSASPYNVGEGRRLSSMFHLIGLAHTKRLPSVLKALPVHRITVRGLFGESSRAVGAFVQISSWVRPLREFEGACEYVIQKERDARGEVARELIHDATRKAIDFIVPSRSVSLADALRVLAWIRWASCAGIAGFASSRQVDTWLTTLEIHTAKDEKVASRERADFMRKHLDR